VHRRERDLLAYEGPQVAEYTQDNHGITDYGWRKEITLGGLSGHALEPPYITKKTGRAQGPQVRSICESSYPAIG
jgi:hypothetical protein